MADSTITIKKLGLVDYEPTWLAMRDFTINRQAQTPDEFWILQHPPVYTLGQAGKTEHIFNAKQILVISVDRGGQVTYHGPGQLVVYLLIDLNRKKLTTKDFVKRIELGIIKSLHSFGIEATTREKAPGVYVDSAKIASLGLRIKNGCSYHGLSLNVDMDLSPFLGINPCGFKDLAMTQVKDIMPDIKMNRLESSLIHHLCSQFGYTMINELISA